MSVRRLLLILPLIIIALVLATSASAGASSRKIVVFQQGVDVLAQADAVRAAGGKPIKPVRLVNAMVAELNADAVRGLSHRPDVVRVEDDAVIEASTAGQPPDVQAQAARPAPGQSKKSTPTPAPAPTSVPTSVPTLAPSPTTAPTTAPTVAPSPTPSSTTQSVPWGISRINASQSWPVSRGDLVKVGVLDSGISLSHPDLNVAGGVSEVSYTTSYDDDEGHGSHVAGTIAALDNTSGVIGVAPAASLYAIKVLDRNGSGYSSDLINGIDWAISNGIQVLNMSLGTASDIQSIHDAVTRAYNAGIVLVAAAGNNGPNDYTVTYPGAYSEVIAVSALDGNNAISSFSSTGPEVDVAAPGVNVYSTYSGTGYSTLSGTSMASPHVAGVAALRKRLHPAETPAQVASVLKGNANPVPGLTADQQGSGMVDAYRVVTAP